MISVNNNLLKSYPCQFWRGFFVFILLWNVNAAAVPGIGIIMGKEGDNCKITIYGVSIGSFKEGKITCQYEQAVDIEEALIGSSVPSISIGASIDRNNRKLIVYLSITGKVSIDSSSMGIIQFPLKGVADNYIFRILDATFTNKQGETFNAEILPATPVFNNHAKALQKTEPVHKYYMLNGRRVENQILKNLEKKSSGYFLPIRIFN